MSEWNMGARNAIQHVIYGIVITAILNSLITTGLINHWFAILATVFNVGLTVAALFMLGQRSGIYLGGWIIGILILLYGGLLNTGLIGTIEMTIYIVVPLGFIGLRIYMWWNR